MKKERKFGLKEFPRPLFHEDGGRYGKKKEAALQKE